MTNDEYIQHVATERGISTEQVMREAVACYRSANEDDGSNIYDDALYLQSAANPRAVVARFNQMVKLIVKELEAEYDVAPTNDVTHHPVFIAMASKLHALAGYGYRDAVAFDLIERRARPETLRLLGIEPRKEVA